MGASFLLGSYKYRKEENCNGFQYLQRQKYRCKCVCTHTSNPWLCGSVYWEDLEGIMSTSSTHSLISKYHSPLKGNGGPWRNGLVPRIGKGKV